MTKRPLTYDEELAAVILPVPKGVLLELFILTKDNQKVEYPLGYLTDTQVTGSDCLTAAVAAVAGLLSGVDDAMSDEYHIQAVKVSDTLVPRVFSAIASPSSPVPGAVSAVSAPGVVSSNVSWHTALAGKSHRGRTGLTGIPANTISGDIINGTQLTAETSVASAIINFDGGLTGWAKAIISHKLGLPFPVVSFVIDTIIDSRRGRLVGRGD